MIARKSDEELEVRANEDIVLRIVEDEQKRNLKFSLFSPKLEREVAFEEIAGSTLLDVRLDEELKEKNHEAEEADITLAIDMLEIWAKENKYSVSHSI
jgi:phosphopantothenoylcysteine synthetase/decarboxylase